MERSCQREPAQKPVNGRELCQWSTCHGALSCVNVGAGAERRAAGERCSAESHHSRARATAAAGREEEEEEEEGDGDECNAGGQPARGCGASPHSVRASRRPAR
eukprot:2650991-Rhodomonas_salina.2